MLTNFFNLGEMNVIFFFIKAETHKIITEGHVDFIFETSTQIGARNMRGFGNLVPTENFIVTAGTSLKVSLPCLKVRTVS